jgi:hypothetical protein
MSDAPTRMAVMALIGMAIVCVVLVIMAGQAVR